MHELDLCRPTEFLAHDDGAAREFALMALPVGAGWPRKHTVVLYYAVRDEIE
jgi:hypothetical protein